MGKALTKKGTGTRQRTRIRGLTRRLRRVCTRISLAGASPLFRRLTASPGNHATVSLSPSFAILRIAIAGSCRNAKPRLLPGLDCLRPPGRCRHFPVACSFQRLSPQELASTPMGRSRRQLRFLQVHAVFFAICVHWITAMVVPPGSMALPTMTR